jgi:hypothetical protein
MPMPRPRIPILLVAVFHPDRRATAWQKVEKATAARDAPPGEPWIFRDHRTMAEVIADEATAA